MNMSLLITGIIFVYIADIFAFIWLSGKFVGIQTLSAKNVGVIGLSIILFSWLVGLALYQVPLVIKPLIMIIAFVIIIYIFVLLLDTHFLKAIAAGLFFIVCQLLIIIVLLRELWTKEFFQIVKFMILHYY